LLVRLGDWEVSAFAPVEVEQVVLS
jgi:hypothetical protein